MIVDLWSNFLWGFATAILVICAMQYLKMGKNNDNFDEKLISFGYSCIFFGLAIACFFRMLSTFFIPGTYINHTFYGNYDNASTNYEVLLKISLIIGCGIYIPFFYAFERIVKKTKYLITISNIISVLLLIILPFNFEILMVWGVFYVLIFLSVLLLYTKWSIPELKAISSLLLLGTILMLIGVGFNTQPSKEQNIIPLIIAPIFYILGALICTVPTIVNPKYFTQALKYWKVIGALVIGLICGVIFVNIFYLFVPLYIGILFVLLLFVIFSLYYTFKSIKTQTISEDVVDIKDFLGAFTRPKKITEEEVSISKEKKICLVCKNELSRENYICPDCKTFYCINCSKTLSDLENACWLCNEPFDASKPSKPFKKEEEIEEIEISEKPQKKPDIDKKSPKKQL